MKDNKDIKRYSLRVGRMGNSLGVSLPKELAEKLNIAQSDEVIQNSQGEVIFKKIRQVQPPENVRDEVREVFYEVFEEDSDILADLRDR